MTVGELVDRLLSNIDVVVVGWKDKEDEVKDYGILWYGDRFQLLCEGNKKWLGGEIKQIDVSDNRFIILV